MSAQTIFRNASPGKSYTPILNAALQDDTLTPEAGWVLVFMLSQRRDWTVNLAYVADKRRMGRDRTQKAVRELIERGYCKRTQHRDAAGRKSHYEYWFSDEPGRFIEPEPELQASATPEPDLPAPEKPETDLQAPYKEITLENNTPPLPPRKRGATGKSLLPDDWKLPDDWREAARKKAPERSLWISSEAEKFFNYHTGKGTMWKDWRKAWLNWWATSCERPIARGAKPGGVATPLPPDEKLRAPVWKPPASAEPVFYRADTPEFNSYITRLIAEGETREAEKLQQQGWVKLRPMKSVGGLARMIAEGKYKPTGASA